MSEPRIRAEEAFTMTDYRDINVKKALRHSCEVRYDRVQLIILAVPGTARELCDY